ncbi:hypothetical protein LJC41_06745, partial [Desulfosarcina sp. OttesenSCG-928-G17]|nr:hypothetical protein [Desulfosarcina sp. OttesenSCG-928-G17]
LIDNRGGRGSRDENTDRLQTAVGRSDKKIIWVSSPIECEVSCELTRVEMRTAGDLYRLEKKTYNGTNQPYWVAHVMAPPRDAEYRLVLTLGENIEMASTRAMLVKAESKSAS